MRERSELIQWIRAELVGPGQFLREPELATFRDREFADPRADRKGSLGWRPIPDSGIQEVLYYERETPHRKYGAGVLHPLGMVDAAREQPETDAASSIDPIGADSDTDATLPETDADGPATSTTSGGTSDADDDDDFDVTSPDIRHPVTMGISFCIKLEPEGKLLINIPTERRFPWQAEGAEPLPVNGRYERCLRKSFTTTGSAQEAPVWRRLPAVVGACSIPVAGTLLQHGKKLPFDVPVPEGSPISLKLEVFPRRMEGAEGSWLVTVVLRNRSSFQSEQQGREATLYQSFFEATVEGGSLLAYPETQRPFDSLDEDEQSLKLLYRESATWAIGHSCAAGWDAEPGMAPESVFADVMPAVQLPSMTADVLDSAGQPIELSMRELGSLPDSVSGPAWASLQRLVDGYAGWISRREVDAGSLSAGLRDVAKRHLSACGRCLQRIRRGIALLESNAEVRRAFRLANVAMLLQQIATKQLTPRAFECVGTPVEVRPSGSFESPWDVYADGRERNVGTWRAFQIAFLLMSLEGVTDGASEDREVVDLIWFPTGGGKTEAYLGVMAFHLFYERIREPHTSGLRSDGTNVLMRYTLRMLTTQQFQRTAALICAMEFLRRNPQSPGIGDLPGERFALGLWIGGDGAPNTNKAARDAMRQFSSGDLEGNPLVITECPWCRAEIGRFNGSRPASMRQAAWNQLRVRGLRDTPEGPRLHCTDPKCSFGKQDPASWLPVEVIDERIYATRPSVIIGTVDKLAMVAYRPHAGALFGRSADGGQTHIPPALIIQDELHLISGPLGTMYAFYECVFERLCSLRTGDTFQKPKLIASTATIRGAAEQVTALYARAETQLFPSPGLLMGDSFFGQYARDSSGRLRDGRLYLGVYASDYGSVLSTQVRTYSSALFRPYLFEETHRDPWWTLLAFYNSIRELGGAKTLFESDIRSRLKFVFNREGFDYQNRRNLRVPEELTSRLSQAEIVGMMNALSRAYSATDNKAVDVCLASSIIEVGVDIDRLSLLGVVGQPKTTAQYIQVTGRVGRRWWERPGLILMIYNPSKSRDRSHFEQFHSYHRRLYERVEPTSATPFAPSAIERALPGALITWARQAASAPVDDLATYQPALEEALAMLEERCKAVQIPADQARSIAELRRGFNELLGKWKKKPQEWEEFPPTPDGRYLMLWPGQYRTVVQEQNGVVAPSSMRQVDSSAELQITQTYSLDQQGGG